jgi:hypothetical protein
MFTTVPMIVTREAGCQRMRLGEYDGDDGNAMAKVLHPWLRRHAAVSLLLASHHTPGRGYFWMYNNPTPTTLAAPTKLDKWDCRSTLYMYMNYTRIIL